MAGSEALKSCACSLLESLFLQVLEGFRRIVDDFTIIAIDRLFEISIEQDEKDFSFWLRRQWLRDCSVCAVFVLN